MAAAFSPVRCILLIILLILVTPDNKSGADSPENDLMNSNIDSEFRHSSTMSCLTGQFLCSWQDVCIPDEYHCDNKIDCLYGEDEENCESALSKFSVTENAVLLPDSDIGPYRFQTYSDVSDEMCAINCLETTTYTCQSFVYSPSRELCALLSLSSVTDGRIIPSIGDNFYELKPKCSYPEKFKCAENNYSIETSSICDRINNCMDQSNELVCNNVKHSCRPDQLRCDNNLCVSLLQFCDMNYDCGDFSDEDNFTKYKLMNGQSLREGTVVLERNGLQGTICDKGWDDKDATVICHSLGFIYGGKAIMGGYFGPRYGPIWFENVQCTGREKSLESCPHGGWLNHNCDHSQDAGVICHDNPEKLTVIGDSLRTKTAQTAIKGTRKCGNRASGYEDEENKSFWRDSIANKIIEDDFKKENNLFKVSQPQAKFKIAGGYSAVYGEYPWQARLEIVVNSSDSNSSSVQCGGVIVNDYWLLTAAHCFLEGKHKGSIVYVGDYDTTKTDFAEERYYMEKVITHEKFDNLTGNNDIALIKIKPKKNGSGMQFNKYVQPACLPFSVKYEPGSKCLISGWGDTLSGGQSVRLRAASVPIMSQSQCKYLYRMYKERITDKIICAGYINGGIDTCFGDSGGPLVCKTGDFFTLFGISSWGEGCALPNFPGVYTQISHYLPWIEKVLKKVE